MKKSLYIVQSTAGQLNIDIQLEGRTHLNIYSSASTLISRQLSNFYRKPFIHPKYGEFLTVEGLWYYVKTGMKHEHLRDLHGFDAKRSGIKLPIVDNPSFKEDILLAHQAWLLQHASIRETFFDTTAPLTHHYIFHSHVKDAFTRNRFQIDYLAACREAKEVLTDFTPFITS